MAEDTPVPEPGLVVLEPEYLRKLLVIVAEKAGLPVALNSRGIEKMADILAEMNIVAMQAKDPGIAYRVGKVCQSGESDLIYVMKRKA